MKKLSITILSLFFSIYLSAQSDIANRDLENWTVETSTFGNYDVPDSEWTTANRVVRLGFPASTFKVTDAYSGAYAAKMITTTANIANPPLLVTGTLATGIFNELATPPDNLKFGTPFTARPVRFKGYYKYMPVNGDSCALYTLLTKWNTGTNSRDTLGRAMLPNDTQTVTAYTLFDIPFVYSSQNNPDSITVVFASSAYGNHLMGQPGSTLYIDDISFDMTNGIEMVLMPEVKVTIFPNPANDYLYFNTDKKLKKGNLIIYNEEGIKVKSVDINSINNKITVNDLAGGNYFYLLSDGNDKMNSGSFVINK